MINPLLLFGCSAVGQHAWSRTYLTWKGHEERICEWCGKKEKRPARG